MEIAGRHTTLPRRLQESGRAGISPVAKPYCPVRLTGYCRVQSTAHRQVALPSNETVVHYQLYRCLGISRVLTHADYVG